YYYKYKTSKGSYPKDYSGNGAQFAPISDGKISIDIMSEGRLNSDDKSGIKLKITNNTDSLVNVNVSDDDKNNQRVTVDGNSSKISVNQK
ncbi:Type IV pilus assembly protein PilO, partial [human gut metagenome]